MHFVYAGLGAAGAAVLCVFMTLGVMRETVRAGDVSLSAIIRELPSPGSNQNPVSAGTSVRMPRALDERFSTGATAEGADAVVALAAVVTREGRIASLELLRAQGLPSIPPGADEGTLVNEMLGAASEARFEPASVAGAPVAINVVWIVAHTTVRAPKDALELEMRPAPRRRAALSHAPASLTTRGV
jgi:hypothetical protein